jgi:hypothetical protein
MLTMEKLGQVTFRVPQSLKDAWDVMCVERGVSQQVAAERLIAFLVEQDATVQAWILRTIPEPEGGLAIRAAVARLYDPKPRLADVVRTNGSTPPPPPDAPPSRRPRSRG